MWSFSSLLGRGKERLLGWRWGEKSLISLYISVLSGIVLALQYNPAEPFYSTSTVEILVPFGAFWRSVHFYSSQLFFLFSLAHFTVILVEKWPPTYAFSRWLRLVASLPVITLLLFTGYVLRGDITGEMAGRIAENITLSIPFLGRWLNELLFSVADEHLKRVYANHLIGLGILWGILSWDHVKKFKVNWRRNGGLLVGLLVFCFFIDAPMDQAMLGDFHILGPWFFIGLQELLRYIQPFWAGVVFPTSIFVALALLASEKTEVRRTALWYSACWLGVYLILTLVGFGRG